MEGIISKEPVRWPDLTAVAERYVVKSRDGKYLIRMSFGSEEEANKVAVNDGITVVQNLE